jgi:lactam utilization protein B
MPDRGKPMKDAHVKVTVEEQVRMQAILLDGDKDEALEFVRMIRDRIEASENLGMRSHLDT